MEKGTDELFMKLALIEAQKAFDNNEVPVGAIIVHNNKVIAKAHNQTVLLNDPTAHAEMLAITSATSTIGSRHLNKCTLYITAEPCVMCAGASFWAQIGRIVYGTSDNKKGYTILSPKLFSDKTKIESGVLADECKYIMQKFFTNLRQ